MSHRKCAGCGTHFIPPRAWHLICRECLKLHIAIRKALAAAKALRRSQMGAP
jgi:hypothetical protein